MRRAGRRVRRVGGALLTPALAIVLVAGCQDAVGGSGTGPDGHRGATTGPDASASPAGGATRTVQVQLLADSGGSPDSPSDTATVLYTDRHGQTRTETFQRTWTTSFTMDSDAASGILLQLLVTPPIGLGTPPTADCSISVNGKTVSTDSGPVATCTTALPATP